MVNVIWTGDTLAIVWFWQVSNLIYKPYCVSSMPERKLITFDTPRCSGERPLFARFYLISLSTVERQLNKQEGVLSEGLDAGSGERRQMTAAASRWIPAFFHECLTVQTESACAASLRRSVLFTSVVVARSIVLLPIWQQSPQSAPILSNRCRINNGNHIRKATAAGPERWCKTETYNMHKSFLFPFIFLFLTFWYFFVYFPHFFFFWQQHFLSDHCDGLGLSV